jgi:hypothetical protein
MRIRRAAATLIVGGCLAVTAAPAQAQPVLVKGAQSFADPSHPCFDPDSVFSLSMAGGLVGCWWVDTSNDVLHPSGTLRSTGTEHFTGCIDANGDEACGADEPWGTFWTTFIFTAKLAADGSELQGRCSHPIVSGSDDFDGASGILTFQDDVSTGIAYYVGIVKLSGGGSIAKVASARTVSSARAASVTAAGC